MGKKFCGCMKYRTLAVLALLLQISALVLTVVTLQWGGLGGYIAKIVLLSVCICCCKKDTCPRCTTAVLFFVFAGLETIGVLYAFAVRKAISWTLCYDRYRNSYDYDWENYSSYEDTEEFKSC